MRKDIGHQSFLVRTNETSYLKLFLFFPFSIGLEKRRRMREQNVSEY